MIVQIVLEQWNKFYQINIMNYKCKAILTIVI